MSSFSEKMTAIADEIRRYTLKPDKLSLDAMPQSIHGVYDAGYTNGLRNGKQSEYNNFWAAYQDNGNRRDYQNCFSGKGWTKETFKPKYDIHVTQGYMMFRYNQAEVDLVEWFRELGITFDESNNTNVAYMYFNSNFTRIGTVTLPRTTTGDMFNSCFKLKTIDKIISNDGVTYTGSTFGNCEKLENVTFEGVIAKSISFWQSPLLTNSSVQSIINALKDLTGTTAQTLTLHADVGAKLTDAQRATISAKNWTLVY